jgi:hypothetical protein
VRLIDLVFRQGHLSERAIVDAVTAGTRPLHLDRCDICAERAVELARFLDHVKTDAVELSDSVFTSERLAAGQHQILRRLEQLDHPARVISFPAASRHELRAGERRVAVSWVGVAAAAGLVLGLLGGQISARLTQHAPASPATSAADAATLAMLNESANAPGNPAVFREDYENLDIPSLGVVSDLTPRMTQVSAKNGR